MGSDISGALVLHAFSEYLDKLKSVFTSGEFIVGFVAFTTHIFVQIASVVSRHMAVAFRIPADTTGIYFTKLFSLRRLLTLSASILSYIIKLMVAEDNIGLTLTFWVFVFLSRLVFMLYLHLSRRPALHIYHVFVLEALSVGLFQMTFYSMTAEYVSVLSVCFKVSKLTIFLLQLLMDCFLYDRPFLMVKIHYWIGFAATTISTALWFLYCVRRHKKITDLNGMSTGLKLAPNGKVVSTYGNGGHPTNGLNRSLPTGTTVTTSNTLTTSIFGSTSNSATNSTTNGSHDVNNGSTVGDNTHANNINGSNTQSTNCKKAFKDLEKEEPSFLTHLGNCISPLLMCIVTLMMKNILYPGLLPYALLERDKCHAINMVITPVGLASSTTIHALKKHVESIRRRWEWYWHLFWLFAIPPAIIFYLTFKALHSRSRTSRLIRNNQRVVFIIAVVFFSTHTMIESAGYLGVVSNVKHCGKVLERGMKMISTNQLLGEITSFIFYKFSIGYNVNRISLGYFLPRFRPIHRMSKWNTFWYILKNTLKTGFQDFMNDFKMNIRKYI